MPHGGQGGQDWWITRSVRSMRREGSGHGMCPLLPGGTVAGDCGCGCGRPGWEAARGQGVQIREELVSISSTAGGAACLLHCLAGREGSGL